ncbi:cupin domain-containing protein [Massilia sp. KIM]|uniref:cupin domain-containing protein n=1 Tax=Massilia sp. KIM TaxID=1955422 RepID=UPI00098F4545|nr:cupin domain-containing protein [Massilia sp. KIM]
MSQRTRHILEAKPSRASLSRLRRLAPAVLLAVAPLGAALAHGPADHAAPGAEKVTLLQRQPLARAPGTAIQMISVEYAPGQVSIPHRHPGAAFVYVVEGEVVSRLEGGQEVRYRAGQSWYEPPGVPHLVSRNASATRKARMVAVLVHGENEPVLEPLPAR